MMPIPTTDKTSIRNTVVQWGGLCAVQDANGIVDLPCCIVFNILANTWCCAGSLASWANHSAYMHNAESILDDAIKAWQACENVTHDLLLNTAKQIITTMTDLVRRATRDQTRTRLYSKPNVPKSNTVRRDEWSQWYPTDREKWHDSIAVFEYGFQTKSNNLTVSSKIDPVPDIEAELDIYWQPIHTRQSQDFCNKRVRKNPIMPLTSDHMLSRSTDLMQLFSS